MALSDASLAELMAELRTRLRHFLSGAVARGTRAAPLGGQDPAPVVANAREPGPLDLAGRASLAARLLAVVLGSREDAAAIDLARSFAELADALAGTPAPLPGSALEVGLRQLVRELEGLAITWDRESEPDLRQAWSNLRALGDRLWADTPSPRNVQAGSALEAAGSPSMRAGSGHAVWLLVAGDLRRATLRRRLARAGWTVDCLPDAEAVLARLERSRPSAVICDDAAPCRHHSRLRRLLPPSAPTVIQIRGRASRDQTREPLWLPPFRPEDLASRLAD